MALLSGWVYRESGVVSGISNRRWGSLFSHSFVTFRKEGSREPSKVWPLHGHCKLSSVERKEVMIRNRHTSTIWALAAGHYEKKQLVSLQSHEQRDIGGLSLCRGSIQDAAAGELKPATAHLAPGGSSRPSAHCLQLQQEAAGERVVRSCMSVKQP